MSKSAYELELELKKIQEKLDEAKIKLQEKQGEYQRVSKELGLDPCALEIAEVLSRERPTFANEEMAQERVYLVQLLEQTSHCFAPALGFCYLQ